MNEAIEYPKIETLFDRGDDFAVDEARLRLPEFMLVSEWLVTEKVDGTNVRVVLDNEGGADSLKGRVRFYGRTADAQMPTFLLSYLSDTFTYECLRAAFPWWGISPTITWMPESAPVVTLYGEGYGPKIQGAGGNYRPKDAGVSFRLFDVRVGAKWLDWHNVVSVALRMGIQTVPDLGFYTPKQAVSLAKGFPSSVANHENGGAVFPAEGIVARTDPSLYLWDGRRLMWKLKAKDFEPGRSKKSGRAEAAV